MTIKLRSLPAAILFMVLVAGVKTVGLVEAISIGAPAHATTQEHKPKPTEEMPKGEEKPKAVAEQKPAAVAVLAPPAEPPITDAERTALQDLRERRKQLDSRASKLDEREAILSAAEQRMTDRIKQLTTLQTKLEDLEKLRHEREEANWTGLVKTYETMRPRDAATIFNELDNNILIQVLDRMKDAKAGAILAAMLPDRARAATLQLAQYRGQVSAAPHVEPVSGAKP